MSHLKKNNGQHIKIIRPLGSPSSDSSTTDKSEPSLLNYCSSSGYDSPPETPAMKISDNDKKEPMAQMGFLEELKRLAEKRRSDSDGLLLDSLKKTTVSATHDKIEVDGSEDQDKIQDVSEIIINERKIKKSGPDLEKKRQHELLMQEFKTAHLRMFKDKKVISAAVNTQTLPDPKSTTIDPVSLSTAALIDKFSKVENEKPFKFRQALDYNTSPNKVFLSRWQSSSVLSVNGFQGTKILASKQIDKEAPAIKENNAQNFVKTRVATPIVQEKVKMLTTKRVLPSNPSNPTFQLFKSSSCMNVNEKEKVFMIPRVKGIQILSTRCTLQQTQQRRSSQLMSRVRLFE